ncbi:Asn-hydroxylation Stabilises the ankyrin repeat domain protein [Baffinella frigidus]|nr:Asn-hydroxylation Stabilises the ankyrin repeat domain protein [Cryptophyta sp. CCMP2293]
MSKEGKELRSAARFGSAFQVFNLIEAGAPIEERDNIGATPLSIAALNGREAVTRVLLDHGANKDAESEGGATPLDVALLKVPL